MGPFTLFRPQHLGNTRCVVFVGRGVLFLLVSMAPHLTKFELDFIFEEEAKGVSMKEIHRKVQRRRAMQGHDAPCLRRFSEAFRGRTYTGGPKKRREAENALSLGSGCTSWTGPERSCNERHKENSKYAGRMSAEPLVHPKHTGAH